MPERATGVVDQKLEAFERLVADLSSRFSVLSTDEVPAAIAAALQGIVETLDVDRSTIMEMSEPDGAVTAMHVWGRPDIPSLGDIDRAAMRWYFGRLSEGADVRFSDIERELPDDATAEREYARRLGMKSILTLPVAVGGRLVCALSLGAFRQHREWPAPLVDRARLVGQIIAAALLRRRDELALRASLAEIERLNRRLQAENLYLQEEIRSDHDFDQIVGNSQVLRLALSRVEQVAPTDSTVLLSGESGTGKELVARAIHDRSSRRQRPLVRVNCAALPHALIESELFGHEKGAFTGAVAQRQGRFEIADGGTLFLDEIGDLPMELQGKLLRVLQDGEFERVGSSRTRRADVRLIAATNRDLESAIRGGAFRLDLYYRLSVFPIVMPPLRDRPDDIPQLVWWFVDRFQRQLGRRVRRVPRHTMDALQRYDWPGNVRELENVVERAMIRSTGEALEIDENLGATKRKSRASFPGTLAAVERAHIEAVLADCRWRINGPGHAAEKLGLHPNTLRFRMKKLGITRPARRPA